MVHFRYPTRLVILAVLLAVAGMVVSGILLQHHVVAQIGGDPVLGGVCEAARSFSCDEVIASEWGKLTLVAGEWRVEIPTAMLGYVFFAALGSWLLIFGVPQGPQRRLHVVPTLFVLAGLAAAGGFEYVMFALLGKLCPLCMLTHAFILLLFVVVLLMWRRRPVQLAADDDRRGFTAPGVPQVLPAGRLFLATLVLTGATTALGWYIYKSQLHSGYANAYFARWQDYDKDTRLNYDRFLAQVPLDIAVHPDDPVLGPADAKHTVVVFSDFLCPYCKMLAAMLDQRRKEFPGEFRIVFKHFPLDKNCNPELKNSLNPNACVGAAAVEAARLLKGNDAFWTLHDFIFRSPNRFSAEKVIEEVAKLGITRDEYVRKINTASTLDHVKINIAQGRKLGLESAPNLFFDGRPLKAWGDRHLWRYLLSDETLESTARSSTQPASAPALSPGEAATTHPADASADR